MLGPRLFDYFNKNVLKISSHNSSSYFCFSYIQRKFQIKLTYYGQKSVQQVEFNINRPFFKRFVKFLFLGPKWL